MFKIANAGQLAAIPANPIAIEARLAPDRLGWAEVVNLSPYLFELQDEGSIVRKAIPPFSVVVAQVRVKAQRLFMVPIGTFATAVAPANFAIYVDVTETKPEPTSVLAPAEGGGGLIGSVRVEDGTSAALAQVVALQAGVAGGNGLAVASQSMLNNQTSGSLTPQRSADVTTLGQFSSASAGLVALPGEWSAQNNPAAGLQASASRVAGGVGISHVCRRVSFGFSSQAALGAATSVTFNLRDGATGAGAIKEAWTFDLPAAIIVPFAISFELNLPGTANTAMTLETLAAVAGLRVFVNLAGFDAN